jgi:MFS transporter, ACS family, hexuronate transporter
MSKAAGTDGAAPEPGLWQPRLLLLTLTHIVGTAGYMSVMAMAPVIRSDLDISAASFGFFMSAFFGAQMFAALPSGAITDRLGVGWTLTVSMWLMAAGIGIFALAPGFEVALAAMFVTGLGYSLVNPATGRGVLEWFPRRRRGTAMGIKQLGVPLGGVLAAGAGALVVVLSWQSILWMVVLAGFATAFLTFVIAKLPMRPEGRSAFGDIRSVLADRNLGVIAASVVTFNMGQSTLFAYLTLFVRDAALASQPVAGLCMALAQSASATGRVGFSYLSDTLFRGARKPVISGILAASVLAMLLASQVGPGWSTFWLALVALALGGSIAAYAALIIAITVETTEPELSGSAIGYNALAWSFGGTVGPPLFGWVLDISGGYGAAWIVTAGVVAAGLTLFIFGFREKQVPEG